MSDVLVRDIPETGRVLAVDLGEVRVGLALSDASQTVGAPHETLSVSRGAGDEEICAAVAEVAGDVAAVGIVVGLPRDLSGRDGPAAQRARRIAERLAVAAGVPVALWDERFTTTEAERVMIEQGTRRRKRRQSIDRVAASLILQGFLESRRHARGAKD